jgi:hypothetical protein
MEEKKDKKRKGKKKRQIMKGKARQALGLKGLYGIKLSITVLLYKSPIGCRE